MSLRNLFKNKKNKSKYAKDFCVSTTRPLLSNKLSVSKPSNANIIKTDDEEKYSPSTDTPIHSYGYTIPGFDSYIPPHKDTSSIAIIFKDYGYKLIQLIRNTSQGQIFEVCCMKNTSQRFAIKIVDKELFLKKTTKKDHVSGTALYTEKNILKHALILNHCTVSNSPPGPHIAQFEGFFDDEKYYYLVMEYYGNVTLKSWVETAFKYIENDKLDIKQYRKMVKFVFWQLSVAIYWLHNDMNICHLNITMDNIMIKDGDFIEGDDGMININKRICIKLCDFEMAEIFKTGNYIGKTSKYDFDCSKKDDTSKYSVSNVFKMNTFNAKKSDTWSMGILFHKLIFNQYPIDCGTVNDTGLLALKTDKLTTYIKVNRLSKYSTETSLALVCGLLNCNEKRRFDTLQILQSAWLAAYWQRYRIRLTKKSLTQREELNNEWQKKMMMNYPYYRKR